MKKSFISLLTIISIIAFFYSCDNPTSNDENKTPEISNLSANPTSVGLSGTSSLNCSATDSDGDELSYVWNASSGSINGSGHSVNWIAPNREGSFSISCKVLDGNGGSDEKSINIDVTGGSSSGDYLNWNFNSNNSIIGKLKYKIDNNSFEGEINATTGQSFTCGNPTFTNTSQVKKVSFTRTIGEAQKYYGWFSADDKFISGYFKYGSKERPWFSFNNNVPSLKSNVSINDLSGQWDFNSNSSLTGTLSITKNGNSYAATLSSSSTNFGNFVITVNSESAKITFKRTSGESQSYTGWFSANGNFITGYFKYGSKERPFYAIKK